MHKTLKFVQGSVSKKEFLPVLKHFVIENGTVRGFNGIIALCAPVPLSLSCKPRAEQLVDAVANCTEDVSMALTETGRLRIRSGKFATSVDCSPEEETPHAKPDGVKYLIDGATFLEAVKTLAPFVSDDASRPWSNAILFWHDKAYATNNVIAAEYTMASPVFQDAVVIRREAVKEILRIGDPPVAVQIARNSVTLHYGDNLWLFSLLGDANQWPNLPALLGKVEDGVQMPVDPDLFEGLAYLRKRADKIGRVYFGNGKLCTVDENEPDGTEYHLPWLTHKAIYNIDMFSLLKDVVHTFDFTNWPVPSKFYSEDKRLIGVIAGLKL